MGNDEIMELGGDILIYQTEKGDIRIDVFFRNNDIWMNQSTLDESVCPCQTIQYNPPKKKKKYNHAYPQYLCGRGIR